MSDTPVPPTQFPRLLAVDLTSLSDEELQALRMECFRRGCSFEQLLSALVVEATNRIMNPPTQQ